MQIELSTVLTFGSALLTFFIALYLGILKFTVDRELKRVDDKFMVQQMKIDAEIEARTRAIALETAGRLETLERLHQDELATTQLQGNLALIRQAQDNYEKSLTNHANNLKEMVTKAEIKHLEDLIKQLMSQLQIRPGAYQRAETPYRGMPAQSSDPPKRER